MRATLDLPTKHVEYQTKITAAAVSPRMIMPFRPPLRKKRRNVWGQREINARAEEGKGEGIGSLRAIHI